MILATRTNSTGTTLRAWLAHHGQFTNKVCVAIHVKPDADIHRVLNILGDFPHVRYVRSDWNNGYFDNGKSCTDLQALCLSEFPEEKVILHLDQDEFISWPDRIATIERDLLENKYDYAEGRMVDRLGPGYTTYETQDTLDALRHAAPVNSQLGSGFADPTLKCYMTRGHIVIHEADHHTGTRKHPLGMWLEHYAWTTDCQLRMCEKQVEGYSEHPFAKHKQWKAWSVATKQAHFVEIAKKHFRPMCETLDGWFDYSDLYRKLVKSALPGETIVELGVWCGKSLAYMGEYAALVGKPLKLIGYDQFQPEYYLGVPGKVGRKTSQDWLSFVQDNLRRCVPWNTPEVFKSDSAIASERHEDNSVFAVFVDAGHSYENCLADIRAWYPKIRPGGILCGHDLTPKHYPGVVQALRDSKLAFQPISKSSWIVHK